MAIDILAGVKVALKRGLVLSARCRIEKAYANHAMFQGKFDFKIS